MKFLSVCSGIEAASVAWTPLGFEAVAFSEVEKFPCAVLTHHYPGVPNLGDMTKVEGEKYRGAVDILVGGTPCQAFSVAGLRAGLVDPRGNLTLVFAKLADDIAPPYVVWENVPGVLSSKDNAFGCFLGLLAGEDDALVAPGGKWADAGYVLGPKRAIAWRVLDAQYFGLAQRRRRVFVVACPRNGPDPREILFEQQSLRRDTPPSREAGQGATHDVAPCVGASGRGFERGGDTRGQDPVVAVSEVAATLRSGCTNPASHGKLNGSDRQEFVACLNGLSEYGASVPTLRSKGGDCAGGSEALLCFGGNNTSGPIDVATARNSSGSASGRLDFESETFAVTGPLCANGKAAGSATQQDAEQGMLAVSVALRGREGGATAELGDDCGHALRASGGGGDKPHVLAFRDDITPKVQADLAFTLTQPSPSGGGHPQSVLAFHQNQRTEVTMNDTAGALNKGGGKPGQGYPAIIARQESEALVQEGVNQGGRHASSQEAHPGSVLRALREEVGEKAFTEWGLGILISFLQEEVLRQAVHGRELRLPARSRDWLVYNALSRKEDRAERAMLTLREAGCEGRASQGWRPSEQLLRELGAYLSKLSQPGASGATVLRDLWSASQGPGVLREALSAVQEVGRPDCGQGKPAHAMQVRRLVCEECEFLQGFPRSYTLIPWRGKPASECPDGPRYKALGNSMAVPCMAFIGARIKRSTQT